MVILILGITVSSSYKTSVLKQEARDAAVIRPLEELSHIAFFNDEYVDLQTYIAFVPKTDGALSILVSNINNVIVASDDIRKLGKTIPELKDEGNLYWRQKELKNASGVLGKISVQFSRAALNEANYKLFYLGLSIALIGMIISAVVGIMMGRLLTRRLDVLRKAAQHYANGNFDHRATFAGNDEISELGGAFNLMAQMLQSHISEIEQSHERFRLAITGTNDGIWDWDILKGKIYYSPEYLAILGLSPEDPEVESIDCWRDRVHPEDFPHVLGNLIEHLDGKESYFAYEHRMRKKNNDYIWVLIRARAQFNEGVPTRISGSLSDITIRKQYEQKIHHQAMHDSLTGLPNRSLFEDRLQSTLHTAKRNDKPVVVLMMDLNGFKKINDTYGHLVGDQLLKEVAQRISSVIRSQDTISRFGGDEFLLILPETDSDQAINVIQKIDQCLSRKFIVSQYEFFISSSIGGATFPRDGEQTEDLMKCADSAMYAAKSSGYLFQFFSEKEKPSNVIPMRKGRGRR